ncbi:glucarate transporter [Edaphobacter acidisoli]|uniref:Glucarate transporter n=1 Tax=Edaphobacter acidisoli TaxID=2040573 RepID=A0A916VZN3_9BACT|nr:MFS transporter [Edaphobacter acidisoli]GGA55424.1 glucarate transporter [Edaphobacter acidisoli]
MKKRHGVLGLLCCVSVITFVDRLAIPVAATGIRADLHLSPQQWGWVLSAYVLANAVFEIPSGAFGDRRGQRLELTRISVWWSAFTALTGWCRSFWQIVSSRFLFGMGAAGAYPNAAGVISRWFPKREHAQAQGFVWAASRLGGALAPLLLVPFAARFGWRAIFWMLGAVGIVWALVWRSWFRDAPEEMEGISVDELMEIGSFEREERSVPWARLVRLPHLWLIVAAYFCYAFGSWFYFGWFTTWLVRGAGFSVAQMGVFASFPFVMGVVGNLVGGVLGERMVERFGRKTSYRWIASVALVVTAGILLAMSLVRSHAAIVALATVGFGVMDLMLPAAWAMCMSLGGQFGGTATGMMNTAGNLGGWVCTVAFGYLVGISGDYNLPVRVIAAMVLVAALLFALVDCTRGLQDDLRVSRVA